MGGIKLLGLSIQSPMLMLGLLALVIPVAIHLLSKSRGRIVPFAHTALIQVKASPRLRQLRLSQRWLLLLRCLLLCLATLMIAKLYWQNTDSHDQHVLITEDWLNHSTQAQKQQLRDSNLRQQWILLSQVNQILTWPDIQQWPKAPTASFSTRFNLWQQVANYSNSLDGTAAISVYTTNRFNQFIGSKIPLRSSIKWHIHSLDTEIPSNEITQHILVLYDDKTPQTLSYLQAAFEALNGLEQLKINLQVQSLDNLEIATELLNPIDKMIYLSDTPWAEKLIAQPALSQIAVSKSAVIDKAQLGDVAQVQFVVSLAELLHKEQGHVYQLENLRLSDQQITHTQNNPAHQAFSTQYLNPHRKTLDLWLWMLLVLIFSLERILSEWPKSGRDKVLGDN